MEKRLQISKKIKAEQLVGGLLRLTRYEKIIVWDWGLRDRIGKK